MQKKALYYKQLSNFSVQCQLCPHFCVLKEKEIGKCRVRRNVKGKLFSMVYNSPCSLALDPIEKKPLYHFMPGQSTFSLATVGCNLSCKHCQNWEISQSSPGKIKTQEVKSEKIVELAKQKSKIISYTYTEPTIFYEYMLDIAKLAKKQKLKNITVTNGFINQEPLKELCKYLDASNIDLKSINEEFYKKICRARVTPILEAIKLMYEKGVWIELTNLLIPGQNDSEKDIKKLVLWIKENLGVNIPIHFTAFYPCFELLNVAPTSLSTLKKAREIAINEGLNYVYTGNFQDEGNNTYCHNCKELLIKRVGFSVIENNIKKGKCSFCKAIIPGVWS